MKNALEILVIDDEAPIRRLLQITLESAGYTVRQGANSKEGLLMASNHPPDLILLDLGLPDLSGFEVLDRLRKWYAGPVLILSVKKMEEDIVRALDSGANDYLTKPFRTGELQARIRSALRASLQDKEGITVYNFGDLQLDLTARTLKRSGEAIKLTTTEWALLSLLVRNEGKVLTHSFLLKAVWGPGYTDQSQYLRVYMAQLRKKIEVDANRPQHLLTESGVGYRFAG